MPKRAYLLPGKSQLNVKIIIIADYIKGIIFHAVTNVSWVYQQIFNNF